MQLLMTAVNANSDPNNITINEIEIWDMGLEIVIFKDYIFLYTLLVITIYYDSIYIEK